MSTATAQVPEGDIMDGLIDAEPDMAEELDNKMKEVYEMHKAEMGEICFYSDAVFTDSMEQYE